MSGRITSAAVVPTPPREGREPGADVQRGEAANPPQRREPGGIEAQPSEAGDVEPSAVAAGPRAALLADGLSLCRGRGPTRQVIFTDVHLAIAPGQCLALVGPNGGGKTSLLRSLLGLERPTAGSVEIAGLSPRAACRAGNIVGYVPQRPGVPAALPITARHAVRLAVTGRRLFSRGRAEDLAWADEALRRLAGEEADVIARTPVNDLSGGQLQQVFLARAVANRPRLLLLDEPTVGLDRPAVGRLLGLLRELRRDSSMAVLIATHDHLTALDAAEELIYLDRTVRYHGPTDALPPHLDARLCHHGDGGTQCPTHARHPAAADGQ